MPDPIQPVAAPVDTTTAPITADTPATDGMAEHLETALAAADQFIKDQAAVAEQPPATVVRDEKGRFVGKNPVKTEETAPEPQPAAETPAPPTIGEMWTTAAKIEGFTPEEIAAFADENYAATAIQGRRQQKGYAALQSIGISPDDLAAFNQWRQGGQQQQPVQQQPVQPTVATTLDEFKLELDENEVAPEVASQMKSMAEYINKLAAKQKLDEQEKQQMAQRLGYFEQTAQQSAMAAQAAQAEEAGAAYLEEVVAKIPGFVETFGKPSEVLAARRKNPQDPRVLQFESFLVYGQPAIGRWANALGAQTRPDGRMDPEVVRMALNEAFQASPFSKISTGTSGQGNNGNGYGNGSVPRGSSRKGPAGEPKPNGSAMDAEINRISELVGSAWDAKGHNPVAL